MLTISHKYDDWSEFWISQTNNYVDILGINNITNTTHNNNNNNNNHNRLEVAGVVSDLSETEAWTGEVYYNR